MKKGLKGLSLSLCAMLLLAGCSCKKDEDKFSLGYAFIFMHLGIPCIYYGDEIGMEGNYDPDSRRCFIWDEDKWNKKIYETIKKLISIHKNYCINELDYSISNEEDLICISRFNNDIEYNLYINNSGKDKELVVNNFMLSRPPEYRERINCRLKIINKSPCP